MSRFWAEKRVLSISLVSFIAISSLYVYPAQATLGVISSSDAIGVYMDQPYVQGSYLANNYPSMTVTDTYSATTSGDPCPTIGNVGTYSYASGQCKIIKRIHSGSNYIYGGALTTSSETTTGTSPGITASSQSDSPAIYDSAGTTITFEEDKNYVGLWWSAGSLTNTLKFYQNNALILTLSVDDVCSRVKGSGSCAKPTDTATLTALDNTTTYIKSNYFGHPYSTSTMASVEPFVYVHVFTQNSIKFNKINISTTGNGFEFDNLTVGNLSGAALTPRTSLVPVSSYGSIYSLTYNSQGGTSVDTQTMVSGGQISVTSTRPTKSGSVFSNWSTAVNGSGGTAYASSATFPASGTVSGNATLYAQWTPLTYSITYYDSNTASAAGADGGNAPATQSGSGVGSISLNQNTLSLSNYAFSGWATSNGSTTVAYSDSGTVTIDTNTVLALYPVWIRTYTITASADVNGTISASGTTTVNSGSNQSYTFSPVSGFKISDVLVDGVSQGAITSYTFTNVVANHTISVVFEKISTSAPAPQKSAEQIAAEAAAQKIADEKAA
ncbi:MAG: InlB B-repeat-containing protein, partial [Actinomycetes bacterium]